MTAVLFQDGLAVGPVLDLAVSAGNRWQPPTCWFRVRGFVNLNRSYAILLESGEKWDLLLAKAEASGPLWEVTGVVVAVTPPPMPGSDGSETPQA